MADEQRRAQAAFQGSVGAVIVTDTGVVRALTWVLGASGVLSLAHAFVPLDEFVHRTDDAFYYFKVAFNYPAAGEWTFDGIHRTNGVQPLWAWMLTALAHVMAWVGIRDADVFARSVVALTAVCHVTASLLLFRLLARQVSLAPAVAVAVALLLPLGIVWRHVWGMENSLYALALVATASYYLFRFRGHESDRSAAMLGLWLGVTALSRLNAVLLAVVAVAAIVAEPRGLPLARRLRLGVIIAAVSASCVVPYLAWTYLTTGHPLPISGAVKALQTNELLLQHNLPGRFSLGFVEFVAEEYGRTLRIFVTGRIEDALTLVGGRLVLGEEGDWRFLVLFALVALVPLAFGWRSWVTAGLTALRRLQPLWFIAAFAVINAAVSVFTYPRQIANAMTKWWLVESELLIVVLAGTVVGLAAIAVGRRLVTGPRQRLAALVVVAVLVAAHGARMARTYWDGRFQLAEWNLSWNDECLRAAQWLSTNAPQDAIVGSWNAGVLGFYARQPVTNLDGLMNNFELVPHLQHGTLGTYIVNEGITHLADMEQILSHHRIAEQVRLREVYRRRNALMRLDYVIYEVLGPVSPESGATAPGR
jgi:hypothetical protein